MNEKDVDWSVYSCAQNLSAILNDPNRGKQVSLPFFIISRKHWGCGLTNDWCDVVKFAERFLYKDMG